MEIYNSEQEQVEAIKKWWKENGTSIVLGVVLGLGAVFGWRWWLGYQQQQAAKASVLFEEAMAGLNRNQAEMVKDATGKLESKHAGSTYAIYGAFAQAAEAVESGDLATAEGQLRWALDQAGQPGLKHVARLRLARVLLTDQKADEALTLVNGVDGGAFQSAYDEVRGDILLAQGKKDEARAAYATALETLSPTAGNREVVQMKLDDLAAPTAK